MIPALILTLFAIVFRILLPVFGATEFGVLGNFSPLAAIALCGAFALPKRWAIAVPLIALFISDIVLNLYYGASFFSVFFGVRYGVFLGIALGGIALHRRFEFRHALKALLPASLAGSVLFYLVTNTASWFAEAAYAKTFAGWWQALTVGVPGFPPTWIFFRNTLLSDLLFTALFAACLMVSARKTAHAGVHSVETATI